MLLLIEAFVRHLEQRRHGRVRTVMDDAWGRVAATITQHITIESVSSTCNAVPHASQTACPTQQQQQQPLRIGSDRIFIHIVS